MATKVDLIELLSKKLKYLNEEDSKYAINTVVEYMKSELINGNRIEIRGFGSLSTRKRKYTKKDECYNTIHYRMSKKLYNLINGNEEKNEINY